MGVHMHMHVLAALQPRDVDLAVQHARQRLGEQHHQRHQQHQRRAQPPAAPAP